MGFEAAHCLIRTVARSGLLIFARPVRAKEPAGRRVLVLRAHFFNAGRVDPTAKLSLSHLNPARTYDYT